MVSEAVCLVFGWETKEEEKEERGILCTFRSRCCVPENIEAAREVCRCCAYICILQSCSNSYLLQNQTLEHFTTPGRMNRPALELLLWLRQLIAVLHFNITPVYCTSCSAAKLLGLIHTAGKTVAIYALEQIVLASTFCRECLARTCTYPSSLETQVDRTSAQ